MRNIAIPTLASGLTAALSVVFLLGVSAVYGDETLGGIILVQAAVAMVQMALIPGTWVHILAAPDDQSLRLRYGEGVLIEWTGVLVGLVVVFLGSLAFKLFGVTDYADGAWAMYLSLATTAASSCMGLLRATGQWPRFLAWMIGPNLLRAMAIWATPALVERGLMPDLSANQSFLILFFFLLPDLLRMVTIYLPLAWSHFEWPGVGQTRADLRLFLRNWWYEVGSSLNDVADKLVVGAISGPVPLVTYFFARRFGIITTMVTEPIYAEAYRRLALEGRPVRSGVLAMWKQGLRVAIFFFVAGVSGLFLALHLPRLAGFVPAAVAGNLPLFILILLFDNLLTANRFSRFMTQLAGGGARLLGIRLVIFVIFWLGTLLFTSLALPLALALALGIAWAMESLILFFWTTRLKG